MKNKGIYATEKHNKSKETIEQLFAFYEEQIYENADINKKLLEEIIKQEEIFTKDLTIEQQRNFDKLCELKDENSADTEKRIFLYGFSLATKLLVESMK